MTDDFDGAMLDLDDCAIFDLDDAEFFAIPNIKKDVIKIYLNQKQNNSNSCFQMEEIVNLLTYKTKKLINDINRKNDKFNVELLKTRLHLLWSKGFQCSSGFADLLLKAVKQYNGAVIFEDAVVATSSATGVVISDSKNICISNARNLCIIQGP